MYEKCLKINMDFTAFLVYFLLKKGKQSDGKTRGEKGKERNYTFKFGIMNWKEIKELKEIHLKKILTPH